MSIPTSSKTRLDRAARGLALIFLALSAAYFSALILMAILGKPRLVTPIFRMSHPALRLLHGYLALCGWFLLRQGLHRPFKAWAADVARLLMLLASFLLSFFVGEFALRAHLRNSQGFGSLEDMQKIEQGQAIAKIKSKSPLIKVVKISANKKMVYEAKTNLKLPDFGHLRVWLNQEGMREDIDYPVERVPGKVRIAGIGDSGMWGWGVGQGQNYLAVLESNLNSRAQGTPYEVLNFAVPAYNTVQEVELFKTRGLKYKPDIVILGWCVNDTSPPCFLYTRREFNERNITYFGHWLFARQAYRTMTAPQVADRAYVRKNRLADPDELKEGYKAVAEALEELRQMRDHAGFHLLVFGPMEKEIVSICEQLGLSYYNTLAEIPADRYPKKEYAIHWMHPRDKGHAELAKYLQKALEDRGWITPAN